MPENTLPEEVVPEAVVIADMESYNKYQRSQRDFFPPKCDISVKYKSGKSDVSLRVAYNGFNFVLTSVKKGDSEDIHRFLYGQQQVVNTFADRKTVSAEMTKRYVEQMADRFDQQKSEPGCYMFGGFCVRDADTDDFLGFVISGYSVKPGKPEIAFLFRSDAWNNKAAPTDSKLPSEKPLAKEYKGVATASVACLTQYYQFLQKQGVKAMGQNITAVEATCIDHNPGSWKAMAKFGFKPTKVFVKPGWPGETRYLLNLHLEDIQDRTKPRPSLAKL